MRDIDISPSGSSILTIDENGIARVWSAVSGDPVRRVTFRDDGFQAGAFTDNITLALTVPGGLAFVDAETGKGTVVQAQGVQEYKPVIAVGSNGDFVLVGGVAGKTKAGTLVPRTSGTFGVAAAAPQRSAMVSVLSAIAFREAQLAHWDDDAEHGAFTWQLIKGLRGEADANGDNRIMLGELHSFVETGLKLDNWEERGRTQTPSLQTADPDHALADFTEVAAE